MARNIDEHRTLANFWQPLKKGAKLLATARITDKEYMALGDGRGNRMMVGIRTNPPHIVINHETDYKWNDVFTHVGADVKEGDVATICLSWDDGFWSIQLVGGPKATYASPFSGNNIDYVEGAGDWHRFDLFHHGAPTT